MVMEGSWALFAGECQEGAHCVLCEQWDAATHGARVPESHLWALVGTALVNKMTGLVLEAPPVCDQPLVLRAAARDTLRRSQQWRLAGGVLRSMNGRVAEPRPRSAPDTRVEAVGRRAAARPLRWRLEYVVPANVGGSEAVFVRRVPARAPPQKVQAVAAQPDAPPPQYGLAYGAAVADMVAYGAASGEMAPADMGVPMASPATPQDDSGDLGGGRAMVADDDDDDTVVPGDDEIDLEELTFDYEFFCKKNPEYQGRERETVRREWRNLVKQGKWGSPVFDVRYYLENRKDLQDRLGPDNYLGAFEYFLGHCEEDARTSRMFSWVRYRKRYPDLASYTPKGCFWHFMHKGWKTKRLGN